MGAAKQTIFEARRGLAELEEGRMTPCDEICRTISNGDRRALKGRKVAAHLRDCAACAAFAAAIPSRSADLRALAPALPPAATALLLSRTLGAGASGAGGSSGGGALGAGAAGKTALGLSGAKVATTVALAATATLGVGAALGPTAHRAGAPQARPAAVEAPASAGGTLARPATRPTGPSSAAKAGKASAQARTAASSHRAASAGARAAPRASSATHQNGAHARGSTAAPSATRPQASTPVTTTPPPRSHGNSQNAPGHNRSASAHGNPHTSGTATGPGNGAGNSGLPPGLSVSANAPGHTKLPGSPAQGLGQGPRLCPRPREFWPK